MANEAISEERLQDIQSYYEDLPDSFMSKAYLGMMLSALREAQERAEEAVRENDILRGMASRLMPCHYCGADDMAKCPSGFPGCGLADDLLAGEDTLGQVWKERAEKAEEAGYRRGVEAALKIAEEREKTMAFNSCIRHYIRALLPSDTQAEETP